MLRFRLTLLLLASVIVSTATPTDANEVVRNPTRLTYTDEPVRLRTPAPDQTAFQVLRNDEPVPYQVDTRDGRRSIWVRETLSAGESATYTIKPEAPPTFEPAAKVTRNGDDVTLDNGLIAVRIGATGLNGVRIGGGAWRATSAAAGVVPTSSKIDLIAGPVFVEAVLSQAFPDEARRELRVRMLPGRPFVIVDESHERAPPLRLELSEGWPDARQAVIRRWYSAPFSAAPAVENLPLDPSVTRVPGGIIRVLPRWTQAYDDGWFAGVSDGRQIVAALPIRAGRWVWPHENMILLAVDPNGRASLQARADRGRRHWLLVAGDAALAEQALQIATAAGFAPLDKLHNDYLLDWPGLDERARAPFNPQNFYSNQTNPTDVVRRWGRAELQNVDKPTNSIGALYEAQAYLDPDWYGTYDRFWSPINPNFYTDFIKLGVLKIARLREHPQFESLRARAEHVIRTDLAHSVTLPGGAGQECPGYQQHAAGLWADIAPAVRKYLKYDLTTAPQWRATGKFFARSSVPNGSGRRAFHPGGDTHPGKPDPLAEARKFGYTPDPQRWRTEELPGFGVIFRNATGSADETYLAFKSGPNRGHYHGDSLSFHLSFDARDTAPDHRVSYFERPGQEHMHNRLAFSSEQFPFANMDGYERTIAFKTSDRADIAIGEAQSPRLREVKRLPPEDWDVEHPQQLLTAPLTYRRTIVMVRKGPGVEEDFFVVRDQFIADPADRITAHLHLHVKSSDAPRVQDRRYTFGNLTVHDASIQPAHYEAFDWTPQRDNLKDEATRGLRLTLPAGDARGEIVTVLWPGSRMPDVGREGPHVRVGAVQVRFDDDAKDVVAVSLMDQSLLTLTKDEIDPGRPQGTVGLFVPAAGYPFGPIPDWLIEQRGKIDVRRATTP